MVNYRAIYTLSKLTEKYNMAYLCKIFLSRNKLAFYLCFGSVFFITRQAMSILESQSSSVVQRDRNSTERVTLSTQEVRDWNSSIKATQLPSHKCSKDAWQTTGSKTSLLNSTLVYSAFHDAYKPEYIKVIGLCYVNETRTYFCQLWYPDSQGGVGEMRTNNASVTLIQEDGYAHSACFITCPLSDRRTPVTASIVVGTNFTMPQNTLKVHYIENKTYTRNFTMCLSPIHNFDDSYRLIEWIELNSIFGASHFHIYNFTSTLRLRKVLEFYVQQGIVSLHQWRLPKTKKGDQDVTNLNIYYYGQVAAYNDCLFRSKADSKFVVITDLDEFIVPRMNGSKTWLDIMEQLPFAAGYKFRHCYFPEAFGTAKIEYKGKQLSKEYKLGTLQYLQRLDKINPHVHRGKYIARTIAAYDVCIHNMHSVDRVYLVDPSLAFLHHYRSYVDMSPGSIQYNVPVITDTTVLDKYGDDLVRRVVEIWSKIHTPR